MNKKVAHITDLHLYEEPPILFGANAKENWVVILSDLNKKGIDEIVFTGDIGTLESNAWFFESIKKTNLNMRIVPGNHDTFSEVIKYFPIILPKGREELFYVENYDHVYKFIYLDTSLGEISETQHQWLRNELLTDKKIVLFVHHPILETGTTTQKYYPLSGSEKIKIDFLNVPNQIYIFCGHLHVVDFQNERNIFQYVSPSACYQMKKYSKTTEKDNTNFGYRIIEFAQDRIMTEVIMFGKA